MNEYILIPNPVTGLLDLLDALSQMTFQEYLIGVGFFVGVIVLWGLASMIYLAIWPDLPGPKGTSEQERPAQTADHTDGGAR